MMRIKRAITPVYRYLVNRFKKSKWARRYCRGVGLEIGPLHAPFVLNATVIHLDRMGTRAIRESYEGDPRGALIKPVHLVASAPPYEFIDDDAFDFVASSHVLEHMPNPGLALEEWMRVIKPGAVVYGIIPNKEWSFDRTRTTTPVQQLIDVYEKREPLAPLAQYEDYFLHKELSAGEHRKSGDEILQAFEAQQSIHVYTYNPETAFAFLTAMSERLAARLEFFRAETLDMHFVLRKSK